MKTRIIAFLTFFLFTVVSVQSQIINELKSFVDSTEIIFNNGRRMLYQNIAAGDYSKARQIYIFLNEAAKEKQCNVFTYNEELYIHLLLTDWQEWLVCAQDYSNRIKITSCYNYSESYVERYYNLAFKNLKRLNDELQKQTLSPEQHDLLRIYLHLIANDLEDELYPVFYKAYQRNFPLSTYNDFLKGYLPKPQIKRSIAFSLGPTIMIPTGNLANAFSPGVLFNYTMDINVGKVYAGFHFDAGSLEILKPIAFTDGMQQVMFNPGERFSFVGGGLYVGYFLLRSNRFHVAPFLNIGGYTFESNLYPDNDPEFQVFDSFVFGPGIHTEFRLAEFNIDSYYGASTPGMQPKSYVSLKMDIGYNIITQKVNSLYRGNLPYLRFGLVWGIGNF